MLDPNNMKNNLQLDSGVVVEQGSITDWKNEPSVMTLKNDLVLATPAHDAHSAKVQEWLDLRDVKGKARPKTGKNRSKVQPRLVRKQAEWRYSALSEPFLSSEKLFQVSPTTWEDTAAAEQNSLVLEHQFRTSLNKTKFIDELVRTDVDEGSVCVRLGWNRDTEKVLVDLPVYQYLSVDVGNQEYMQQLQQAVALMTENPNEFFNLPEELQEAVHYFQETGIPVQAQIIGYEQVEEEKILKNHPTLDILHYDNIYLDPTANGDITKAKFGIISFETNKAELLKDKRYKNLDKVNWSGNSPLANPDHHTTSDHTTEFKDELRRTIVAYEYWGWYDIHGNETLVPIVATWIGDTMVRMEENPFPDREIPVVIIPYMPIKKSMHGEPDAELLGDNQAIMGALTRGMIDLMGRSANGQTGFAKGMLDVVNRRRYDEGSDYEFNFNIQPQQGIHQHKFPEIPASAITMLTMQNQEAESLTGVKAFSGGLSGEAYGEVAAGIRGMLDASSKREMSILRRLAQGIAEIGRKIIKMNQVFLSDEEVIRITNDKFVTVRREDIQGEFDLKVDISTAEVEEAKAQDLAFMLQTMGNNMDFNMVKLILAEIARLKRMPELAKRIEEFEPKPDPLDVQLKQLEVQKAQKELEKLDAEIQETASKIQLNQAKARQALSDADKKDLDFVEQETGTTHAREIDKQGAQAEANIKLEAAKAAFNPPQSANT